MITRRHDVARRSAAPIAARRVHQLAPLVAALASALPLLALAAPPAVPAPATVPVPSASWRVFGSGGAAPVNTPNGQGGIDQTIHQSSTKGIYHWATFDIGANSSVTFDMAQKGSSALNRVTGSTAPSQIFGRLSATNGGEVLLINANGILFGKGAQVNVGSLVASALNVSDSEFTSGFAQSLTNPLSPALNAAFRYDGAAEDFIDSRNFVRVDEGAQLTTSSGGRVFLFAKQVENAGTISTPSGQTVLAGGGEIYLKLPTSEAKLYASETNPAVSALRGFLVEVGSGPAAAPEGRDGSATNAATGVISTPRGNTTLVGMAVNQLGRISATTSVSENGSVILRAQGRARSDGLQGVRATASGALVLGEGSRIDIGVDTTPTADGGVATSTDSSGFANSHLDLAGLSVSFERNATIVAPGATVNVRAEQTPTYDLNARRLAGSDEARIVMREGATIDVSGTTGAVASVGREFVTTELLGSNDLKDAPVQKDGLLYRSKVTIDTREDSPILGDLDAYRGNIARSAEERMAEGGTVRLRAEGAVLTEAGSRIDVSGGQMRFTEAQVRETQLVGSDGRLYDLNDAPDDLVYTHATNLQKSSLASFDRWGVQVAYGTVSPTRTEAGYTEGRDAGHVGIEAPTVVLQGALQAGTVQGDRQRAGEAPRAHGGSLHLGAVVNAGKDFSAPDAESIDAVLRQFSVTATGPAVDPGVWLDPMAAPLPEDSGAAIGTLQQGQFEDVAVAADGNVTFGGDGASYWQMVDGGSLRLLSSDANVHLAASVRGAQGHVELHSREWSGHQGAKSSGLVSVGEGVHIDLSGRVVNQSLAGLPLDTSSTAGGRFEAIGYGVTLGKDSLVDVSGGGSVSTTGQFTGADAGTIHLEDVTVEALATEPTLLLGGALHGYSAASHDGRASGGGSLSLSTHHVRISPLGGAGQTPGLALSDDFFSQGGFSEFKVNGSMELRVFEGTQLAPQVAVRQAPRDIADTANGGNAREVLAPGLAPGLRPSAVSLSLSATGAEARDGFGQLRVGEGVLVDAGVQGEIALTASNQLHLDGTLRAQGGQVALTVQAADPLQANVLWVGEHARVDVSGTRVLQPGDTAGRLQGQVLGGGSILLKTDGAHAGHLVLHRDAQLDARGASGELDVTTLGTAGLSTQRQRVDSAGGQVELVSNGGLVAEGQVTLAGGGQAADGSLAVALKGVVFDDGTAQILDRELQVVAQGEVRTPELRPGQLPAAFDMRETTALLGADWLQASGADNLRLTSGNTLSLVDSLELQVDGQLTLQARTIEAGADTTSRLAAGQVFLGWTASDALPGGVPLPPLPAATAGSANVTVQAAHGLTLDGLLSTQGIGQLTLSSGGDVRLQSRESALTGMIDGGLTTEADLTLSGQRIYAATDTRYTIHAANHAVRIERPVGAAPDTHLLPQSARSELTINAAQIVQAGALHAPLGRINLNASDSVVLAEGSVTSVSAAGTSILYGTATDTVWARPVGGALTAPPDKRVVLNAPSVSTEAGSVVDVSGGGDLVATEFVPGRGGSDNILLSSGAYALVPGHSGLSSHTTSASGAAAPGQQVRISQAVTLPDGSRLPAGDYTLLPPEYAMLPGAFLLRPASAPAALASGMSLAQTDGSVLLGAALAQAGQSGSVAAPAQTWQLMSKATLLKYSEVREHSANEYFATIAARAGTVAPELPNDAGAVVIRAAQAQLEGSGRYGAATDAQGQALGQAGRTEIVASKIQVDAEAGQSDDGVLHLSVASLNQLAGGTVVLGASSTGIGSDANGGRVATLQAEAESIVFNQGSAAITVGDLVAAATSSVTVNDGAHFNAAPSGLATGGMGYTVAGDGAALRVSGQEGAAFTRTGATGAAGSLHIGQSVHMAGASLTLDSSAASQIAADARLTGRHITLAAGELQTGSNGATGALLLTPELMAQVSNAQRLTLRGYEGITLAGGSTLGQAALQSLVLDTGHLRHGQEAGVAQVIAGDITLTNSTGTVAAAATAGSGSLSLQATRSSGGGGWLRTGGGAVAVDGVADLVLKAEVGLGLSGETALSTVGDVRIDTPGIVASGLAGELALTAGGALRLENNQGIGPAQSLDGGVFTATASHIEQASRIVLPSGRIELRGRDGVVLAAGSRTDVAGRTVTIDDVAIDQAGGNITLASASGDVVLAAGSRTDVSGSGSEGDGGSLVLSAALGTVTLDGGFTGTAGEQARGAQFSIDAGQGLDTVRLAAALSGQFSGQQSMRQREGDLAIGPAQQYAAERIAISTDEGTLTVLGTLDASGAQGGSIQLDAGRDLEVQGGARLLANAKSVQGDGGRIDLGSRDGRIQTGADTLISLGAGSADGQGGRLTLRAGRTGDALQEVNIGALNGTVDGARRIDVQAVKVYEGIHSIHDTQQGAGTLSYEVVNADNRAFIGSDGAGAESIARRLADGNRALLDVLKVHAEAEVRSEGDLTITAGSDWKLANESLEVAQVPRGRASHVGDSSLTLRAAGTLDLPRGISSGFDNAGVAASDQGGSLRFVAGADLSAASPLATGSQAADLRLSREQLASNRSAPMLVQSTTGDIALAASGTIDFTRGNVAVLTTGGTRDAAADRLDWGGSGLDGSRHAFRSDGGDISLVAGADVLSREGAIIGQDSLFDTATLAGSPESGAWYAQATSASSLPRGVGSYGGGDIRVEAGRDVANLIAVAPSSGYVLADGETVTTKRFDGGDVSLRAGRDVVNGVVSAGGDHIDLAAGRDLAYQPSPPLTPGLRVYTEGGDVQLNARRDATLGFVASRFLSTNLDGWFAGLDNGAQLRAVAASGDLSLRQVASSRDGDYALLPASLRMAAPLGDLAFGDSLGFSSQMVQQPHLQQQLELLAAGSLSIDARVQVNASRQASAEPAYLGRDSLVSELQITDAATAEARWSDGALLDQTQRDPVRLVAAGGDLRLGAFAGVESAMPIRMVASRDIVANAIGVVRVQHQGEGEISVLQAGRDLLLKGWVVRLAGPGDLVVLTGRDIDLGSGSTGDGSGLMAIGNTENTLLPSRSASVTLVAGLKADGTDYQAAVAAGFHVLGSAGLVRHAGDMFALVAGDGSVPPLGSAEANAFDALESAAQLEQVRTLMGAAAYDQALAAYVRGLPGNSALSDSAALAAFAQQSSARRDAAPAALLAGLLDDQPVATRQAFVLQVAQADGPRTGEGLRAWMKLKTGQDLSLAEAAAAFETLPLERQVGWLNQVLVDELRTHGRAAAATSGYDAEAAYLRGYQAINTVFAIDRPQGGDIRLPSTQVKVLQSAGSELLAKTDTERALTLGAITLMAPGGGVNAGEVGSGTQDANKLGVVTVAGGDVASVVERDFSVNQSRVFTLAEGDILLWASEGDIDAGRGAKTVSGAPAPVLRLNAATGRLELDTSGSFTGSGIAVLDAASELDLYAPSGAIDAGEAGIKSRGNAFLGAQVVRGGDNLQFGGAAVGAPIATPSVNPAASLAAAASNAAPSASGDDEDERRRKRMARRTLLLEFLGFGRG